MKSYVASILTIIILLISCSDNVDLKESDVIKYPWLKPFVIGTGNLSGYHNMDLGTMNFKYEYDDAYDEIVNRFNDTIIQYSWTVLSKDEGFWEIEKRFEVYGGQYELTYIKIEIDSLNEQVVFEIK
jgi:hypothetical protein